MKKSVRSPSNAPELPMAQLPRSTKIPIAELRRVGKAYGLTQAVLLAFDGERTHIVTWGATPADCNAASRAQEFWNGGFQNFVLPQAEAGSITISKAP